MTVVERMDELLLQVAVGLVRDALPGPQPALDALLAELQRARQVEVAAVCLHDRLVVSEGVEHDTVLWQCTACGFVWTVDEVGEITLSAYRPSVPAVP